VSNDTFTVTGTAKDNVAVTNVFVALNGAWTNTVSTNSWTNWSAQATLTPGTNIISAYAVDTNGNASATNTVKCFYVVKAVLTVLIDSNLTVTPNYNGQALEIGTAYSMTAKATNSVKGFGAQNWTDGSSNLVAVGATVKFLMVSNLSLTVHYGDNVLPTVRVTTSSTNSNGDPNSIIYHGISADNIGVAGVYYQLNTGPVLSVTDTTNHWTNWTFVLTGLLPGQNNLRVFAVDTSSNVSFNYPVIIQNNTAPVNLLGRQLQVVPDTESGYNLAFGSGKFSQSADDTNHVNGVGSYSYLGSGGVGLLKVKFISPPTATNEGTRNYFLTFLTPTNALYSWTNFIATNFTVVDTNTVPPTTNTIPTNQPVLMTGHMFLSPAPKFAPASMNNQLFFTAGNDATNGFGNFFQSGKFTSYPFAGQQTNKGSYTYAAYSPVAGLFKLVNTNGTEYVIARFGETNYGDYISVDYDPTNLLTLMDKGRFVIGSQKPGGNAPLALTNHNLRVFSGVDEFDVQFDAATFSQESFSTNFDTDVGNYTYDLASTNIGRLNLTATAPPNLTGTNAARLLFLASNAGIFTNEDGTFSAFALASVTNYAPVAITTNNWVDLVETVFTTVRIGFAADGSFSFGTNTIGTYAYTRYSPAGAMLQLNIYTNSFVPNPGGVDWIQLDYNSARLGTNYGDFLVNQFDETNSLIRSFGSTFIQK
jgi:hypothetical protein